MNKYICTFATILLIPSFANAQGWEKPVFWSGHWGPLGGAATSAVRGAESIYFNPAGLSQSNSLIEFNADVSPTMGSSQGGFIKYNNTLASSSVVAGNNAGGVAPPLGLTAVLHPKDVPWGLGGALQFVAGGAGIYDELDLGNLGSQKLKSVTAGELHPFQARGQILFSELSLGGGYEVSDWIRVGAAWRMTLVNGSVQAQVPSKTPINVPLLTPSDVYLYADMAVDGISVLNYSGVRVGAQFGPKDGNWGLGVTYRNQIDVNGSGKLTSSVYIGSDNKFSGESLLGRSLSTIASTAEVTTLLPQQVHIGSHWKFRSNQTIFSQYTFSHWGRNREIGLKGDIIALDLQNNESRTPLTGIVQNWKNSHDLRLGYENLNFYEEYPLRLGFVYSTASTRPEYAAPANLPPGNMFTYSLGTGKKLGDPNVQLDGGLEYSHSSGIGAVPNSTESFKYSFTCFAVHAGLKYFL